MENFTEKIQELDRFALLLAGDAKSDDARIAIDRLQRQIHRARQIFERDFELQNKA